MPGTNLREQLQLEGAMSKIIFLLMLLPLPALAELKFVSTPSGEVVSDVELELTILPAFTWVADPFLKIPGSSRSPASARADDGDYRLQATTLEGEDSVAVVNDRVVRVGDRIGKRTVMKIGADFVLLGDRGSVIEATLSDSKPEPDSRAPASKAVDGSGSKPEGRIIIEEKK